MPECRRDPPARINNPFTCSAVPFPIDAKRRAVFHWFHLLLLLLSFSIYFSRIYHKGTSDDKFHMTTTRLLWMRLENLNPNSQYVVYVVAVAPLGASLPSETLVAWTEPALSAFVDVSVMRCAAWRAGEVTQRRGGFVQISFSRKIIKLSTALSCADGEVWCDTILLSYAKRQRHTKNHHMYGLEYVHIFRAALLYCKQTDSINFSSLGLDNVNFVRMRCSCAFMRIYSPDLYVWNRQLKQMINHVYTYW